MDENQQASVHQDLEKLFPSTESGGRRDESRELYKVGASESSSSATTNTNISFATPSTIK